MLILGILLFGMLVGAAAQLLLGTRIHGINWTTALVAGVLGSFVGGLLISLIAGDGLDLRPSGIIGSILGAVLVTLAWSFWQGCRGPRRRRQRPALRACTPPSRSGLGCWRIVTATSAARARGPRCWRACGGRVVRQPSWRWCL